MFAAGAESAARQPRTRRSPTTGANAASWPSYNRGRRGSGASCGTASKSGFKPYHSINVPKSVDLQSESFASEDQKISTTAMLRNIPNRYTQATLLQEIDKLGFEFAYDFFYLPMDTHNRTNVGYAFINFCTNVDYRKFTDRFTNYKFKTHPSGKIAKVSPAHMQGFRENILHFSNRAVTLSTKPEYRPVVVCGGLRRDLGEVLEEMQAAPAPPPEWCWGSEMPLDFPLELPSPPPGLGDLAPPPGLGWDLNPLAAEFVPSAPATTDVAAFEGESPLASFGLAKLEFENALRGLLQGNAPVATCSKEREEGSSSTEAGSEHGGSLTPRSATTEDDSKPCAASN
eukprot:gnl/TRDRNA2_/TRDRNA2_167545_c2_seq1.p1 gnl/TRDRNA2_/TRDRNA2_167545_c2~~gnl/TRDRNA2_/TRDRNA2_167545_c2_seq1.p1  ORF type:complete len:343 (+),score=55.55 gnl/TRDRNA2_/TRDRNA2_167545_c2_seq1:73-1101(+)